MASQNQVQYSKKGFYNKQITRNHLKNTGGVKPASAARWKYKIQKISVIKFQLQVFHPKNCTSFLKHSIITTEQERKYTSTRKLAILNNKKTFRVVFTLITVNLKTQKKNGFIGSQNPGMLDSCCSSDNIFTKNDWKLGCLPNTLNLIFSVLEIFTW